jgi:hypothetical protein
MNIASRLVAAEWETVSYTAGAYMMTLADFDGCLVVTDAHTGKQTATGRNAFGSIVTMPLDVPLCRGCDGEIVADFCDRCELVFLDDDVKHVGGGWHRVAA